MIKNYIDNHVNKELNIPYFDVLVTKDGKEVFRYFNNQTKTATGKEKLYMYSCSKVITAVCVMMLIERGKLKLEDKVSKYIPSFEDAYLLIDGKKVKPNNEITIKHLLTMSAGLDYNFETPYILEQFDNNPQSSTLEIIDQIIKSPLRFNPGERFCYSLCHDVLGGVIEKASGLKLSDFVDENVFKPLKISNSTFKFDNEGYEPLYYAEKDKVTPYVYKEALWANHKTYESGGGGLKSTVEDYSTFLQGLLSGKLLKEETLDLMTQDYVSDFSVKNSYACIQGGDYGYGLGVRVRKNSTAWGLPVGEFGWDGAAGSYALVDRKNKITITMGMHVRNWPNVFAGEHLKIVELIYKEIL